MLYGMSTKSAKTFLTTKPQTVKTSTIISTSTSPLAQSTVPITKPFWLPWESWVCNRQSDSCFQRRFRNCSTGNDNDCIQSQGGEAYSIGLCMETTCPGCSYFCAVVFVVIVCFFLYFCFLLLFFFVLFFYCFL
jgi:hypothetical protein